MTISTVIAFGLGYLIGGIAYAIVSYKDEQMKCEACKDKDIVMEYIYENS